MAPFNFTGLRQRIASLISPGNTLDRNLFNEAFLFGSGGYTEYDNNNITYLEKGYNYNPIVYAVINQQASKTASIPYTIKRIKDKGSLAKMNQLAQATRSNMSMEQKVRHMMLEHKAFEDDDMKFPMEQPNVNQTWYEFLALYKTFLKLTGNVYIYMLAPTEGQNAGTPIQVYLLPSQYIQIIVKKNASMLGAESPVKGYILTYGRSYIEFDATQVIHIKYPNPNYGENGEHLYGMSPLRAALRNIQSSNKSLDLNIKTLQSGGGFGFFYGKNAPLNEEQSKAFKERLSEMQASPGEMAKIAGTSQEMGFQRMSLTSDELKPFDYLNFDTKQICNVLGWDDKLLNATDGAKYDNMGYALRRVVTDNILPDLKLLADALNKDFLPRFKGYENAVLMFDVSDLPEMQVDMAELVKWLKVSLDSGAIHRNEFRLGMKFSVVDDKNMNVFTVQNDVISLEESINNDFGVV